MGRSQELRIVEEVLTFTVQLYEVTRFMPTEERFGLQSQIRRAAVSIGSNIAEGSRRGSDRDFRRFLDIAAASAAELAYQLRLEAAWTPGYRECRGGGPAPTGANPSE